MEKKKPIPNKKGGIYYGHELLNSNAYWDLSGMEKNVLNVFHLKRILVDSKTIKKFKLKHNSAAIVRNNGEMVYRQNIQLVTDGENTVQINLYIFQERS